MLSTVKIPAVIYLLAALWAIHALQWLVPGDLQHYGILPRSLPDLWHIALAPFLHASLWHLIGNSLPLLGLGILLHLQLEKGTSLWELCALIALLSGLGTWLFGRNAYHIGASAVVLGLWAFILGEAYFRRSVKALGIALVTLIFYSGLAFSLLDFRAHISWAGHISGFISGILIAWLNVRGQTIGDKEG